MRMNMLLFFFVSSVVVFCVVNAVEFPLIDFNMLVSNDRTTVDTVVSALTSVGALQVVGIPNFDLLRKVALESLPGCLKGSLTEGSITKNMPDGSFRLSTVATSVDGKAGPMTSSCGDAAESLRSSVDLASKLIFRALDKFREYNALGESSVLYPFMSFEDVLRYGEHLEHLHSYFSSADSAENSNFSAPLLKPTVDFHTDAGLFIAMTTGLYSEVPSKDSGLYIELPNGARDKAMLRDDALVILVGEGGSRWLSPVAIGSALRVVPHALIAGLRGRSQATRSWYGKMFLPPGDAIIPQEGIPFHEYHQLYSRAITTANANGKSSVDSESLPAACGRLVAAAPRKDDFHLRYSMSSNVYTALVSATDCTIDGEAGINCWMQCMSVAGLSCGQSAECVDPATGQIVDGDTVTCPECIPECVSSSENTSSMFDGYCYGSGVTMFMEGFTSIAYEPKGTTSCLNLIFMHWTLDSNLKFGFACVGVFLFGILVQYLSKLRRELGKLKVTLRINTLIVVVHGAQIVFGYFAMLVAMTYSIELFCMICAGLFVGFAVFNVQAPVAEAADPCCPPEPADDSKPLEAPLLVSSMGNSSQ